MSAHRLWAKWKSCQQRQIDRGLKHSHTASLSLSLSKHINRNRAALPTVHSLKLCCALSLRQTLSCTATLSACEIERERECSWTFVKLRYSFRLVCFSSICLCLDLTWRFGSFYCCLQLSSVACPQLLDSAGDCCLRHWVLSRKESKYFGWQYLNGYTQSIYIYIHTDQAGFNASYWLPVYKSKSKKSCAFNGFSLLFICLLLFL